MFILYSTVGCHLCDQAISLIEASGIPTSDFKIVDIAEDDALVERYGIRIPVLKKEASGEELGWPFDLELLSDWFERVE